MYFLYEKDSNWKYHALILLFCLFLFLFLQNHWSTTGRATPRRPSSPTYLTDARSAPSAAATEVTRSSARSALPSASHRESPKTRAGWPNTCWWGLLLSCFFDPEIWVNLCIVAGIDIHNNAYKYSAGTSFSAPQCITEKPMKVYYLDEWIIIILHVAGFLHPTIF